jgi:predicted DNA-binding transcriptional regulator AlpA
MLGRSGEESRDVLIRMDNTMMEKMKYYTFQLILSGISEPDDNIEDALYESGCDDALLYFKNSISFLEFDRKAGSIRQAIISAIKDVENAGIGVKVVHVAPGDIVTAAEIARRVKLTKEYIRLLTQGKRGPGDFPLPHSLIANTTLWSWAEISKWMYTHTKLKDKEIATNAQFLKDINQVMEIREHKGTYQTQKELLQELEK